MPFRYINPLSNTSTARLSEALQTSTPGRVLKCLPCSALQLLFVSSDVVPREDHVFASTCPWRYVSANDLVKGISCIAKPLVDLPDTG